MSRTARIERVTKESSVILELNLDGTGQVDVETGVPFYDHMMHQLGKHGSFDFCDFHGEPPQLDSTLVEQSSMSALLRSN